MTTAPASLPQTPGACGQPAAQRRARGSARPPGHGPARVRRLRTGSGPGRGGGRRPAPVRRSRTGLGSRGSRPAVRGTCMCCAAPQHQVPGTQGDEGAAVPRHVSVGRGLPCPRLGRGMTRLAGSFAPFREKVAVMHASHCLCSAFPLVCCCSCIYADQETAALCNFICSLCLLLFRVFNDVCQHLKQLRVFVFAEWNQHDI